MEELFGKGCNLGDSMFWLMGLGSMIVFSTVCVSSHGPTDFNHRYSQLWIVIRGFAISEHSVRGQSLLCCTYVPNQSGLDWYPHSCAIYILKYICIKLSLKGESLMVVIGREIYSLVQKGMCMQLDAGGCLRLLAALLEEGYIHSLNQVESWLPSHSLCLPASSKVITCKL